MIEKSERKPMPDYSRKTKDEIIKLLNEANEELELCEGTVEELQEQVGTLQEENQKLQRKLDFEKQHFREMAIIAGRLNKTARIDAQKAKETEWKSLGQWKYAVMVKNKDDMALKESA
ncbi:hypothetical protein GWO43_30330 [candidate division KSB1 bacterium]|nr:hypothetical protein [candidate division KSB1 bacterium]NIV70655.1 hypothetical protein [Phycisphaerae bacterium]NIS28186.1 hypothetical protein [candidate division KSB1 bacterium]NIT75080.1 hypothetical protein [candidate division KSB1 bacterium]NIU28865.1 hypothetical protein [candidate division KSB1 bacterium]